MFLEVGDRLWDVPRKDIHVYTLIRPWSQGLRVQTVYLVYQVLNPMRRDFEGSGSMSWRMA
jgi:hypothetical protein